MKKQIHTRCVLYTLAAISAVFFFAGCALYSLNDDDSGSKLAEAIHLVDKGDDPDVYDENYRSDQISAQIAYANGYYIYRFYARSYVAYKITVSNGSGADMILSCGSSTTSLSTISNGYSKQVTSSGYCYIKVAPKNSTAIGSFTLTVSNIEAYTVDLSLYDYDYGSNTSDTVSGTIAKYGDYHIYTFFARGNINYQVTWTNGAGANVSVSAGRSSDAPTSFFFATTTSGQTVSVPSDMTVYIKVSVTNASSAGSFTLTVSNSTYEVSLTDSESYEMPGTVSLTVGNGRAGVAEPIPLQANTERTCTYTISDGYAHYIRFEPSASTSFTAIVYSAAQKAVKTFNATTTEDYVGGSGTYTLQITADTTGEIGVYVYQIPLSSSGTIRTATVFATPPEDAKPFTYVELNSAESVNYAVSLTAGTTYILQFLNAETAAGSTYTSSYYTYADARCDVYKGSGGFVDFEQSDEVSLFTPETSGSYILSFQKKTSSAEDGWIGFYMYAMD